ncbi:hypothetical protein ACFL3G_05595 [Planctomycetota bacterium]
MKNCNKKSLLIIITSLFVPLLTFAQGSSNFSPEDLIEQISVSEKRVESIEAHFDFSFPISGAIMSADWGFQRGKEYLWGKQSFPIQQKKGKTIPEYTRTFKYGFDGEKAYGVRTHTLKPGWYSGKVSEYVASDFRGILKPTTFLGHDVAPGPMLLSGYLLNAHKVAVKEKFEEIDGHLCTVIEAVGIELSGRNKKHDIRVWIDTQRDFRPLKIEHYESIGGNNRWKVLRAITDEIKLKNIDGIWFPITGRIINYHDKDLQLPDGMTEAEFLALPREKQREIVVVTTEPSKYGYRCPKIYEDTIRINKGIDPNRFKPEFPHGCLIDDDFTGMIYAIGSFDDPAMKPDSEVGRILKQLLDHEVKVRPELKDELISVLKECDVSRNRYKWFAAIRGLVLIGSPAVPDLRRELRRTRKPEMQSAIAFILRAIGDDSAVKVLIDTLSHASANGGSYLGKPTKCDLYKFVKKHQTNPLQPRAGLSSSIEEITVALEKLAGHSEGHLHYPGLYDAKGNPISCNAEVCTIVEAKQAKEDLRVVARRWKLWWKKTKGKTNK